MRLPLTFDWNPDKADENVRKHGISFETVTGIFFDDQRLEDLDDRFDYGEERMNVTGAIGTRVLVVTYTLRGAVHWLISARKATRKERERYGR